VLFVVVSGCFSLSSFFLSMYPLLTSLSSIFFFSVPSFTHAHTLPHTTDGVEEAFYTTDRVMTLSLHKYGDFFPGTGHVQDVGAKEGVGYSVNVPLQQGITDDTYMHDLFVPIFGKIMEVFQPGAIVLQCGADSLTGDRLGCFNLTTHGHAAAVKHVKSYGVPTLVLGGGGYTIRNVARCWANETSVLLEEPISNDIPFNDYYEYYAPDFELHLKPDLSMENANDNLDEIRTEVLQHLQDLQGAPSVQMQQVPPPFRTVAPPMDVDEDDDGDSGSSEKGSKKKGMKKPHASELYDRVD
jgi:histone deacetylase 1/2